MNLFVANINRTVTEEALGALFSEFGQVTSVKIIGDKVPGESKGFGFVEMPNDEEANKAIAALNETELDGRTIVVKPANPKGQDQ